MQRNQPMTENGPQSLYPVCAPIDSRRPNMMGHQGSAGSKSTPDPMQDEMNEARFMFPLSYSLIRSYKLSSGLFVSPKKQVQSFNYVLPTSFIFPRPAVTAEHIKLFSVRCGLCVSE